MLSDPTKSPSLLLCNPLIWARCASYIVGIRISGQVIINFGINEIELFWIQSNEVGGSTHMEKEGFVRAVAALKQEGFKIDVIVTDRHPQIQCYMKKEEMQGTTHYYDCWHVGKS